MSSPSANSSTSEYSVPRLRDWISAMRLRTLPLAAAAIVLGSAMAIREGRFEWSVFLFAIVTALLLQILSNLANDYGDSIHGADSVERKGPARAVQSGVISASQMKRAMILCGLMALISGLALIWLGLDCWMERLLFLGLGLLAIFAAVLYTNGWRPYGYMGLGDLFVFLFFGLVSVVGVYFLHAGDLKSSVIAPAVAMGLLAVGVLNVNNIRDIESDREAGKNSIPVRVGLQAARAYHTFLVVGGYVSGFWSVWGQVTGWFSWSLLIWLPLFLIHLRTVWTTDSVALDPELKRLALTSFFFLVHISGLLIFV